MSYGYNTDAGDIGWNVEPDRCDNDPHDVAEAAANYSCGHQCPTCGEHTDEWWDAYDIALTNALADIYT